MLRLRCACGWETTGAEDMLVAEAIDHGIRIHNMRPTREEVLAMVIPDTVEGGGEPAQGGSPAGTATA
jgi:hypothetical protein